MAVDAGAGTVGTPASAAVTWFWLVSAYCTCPGRGRLASRFARRRSSSRHLPPADPVPAPGASSGSRGDGGDRLADGEPIDRSARHAGRGAAEASHGARRRGTLARHRRVARPASTWRVLRPAVMRGFRTDSTSIVLRGEIRAGSDGGRRGESTSRTLTPRVLNASLAERRSSRLSSTGCRHHTRFEGEFQRTAQRWGRIIEAWTKGPEDRLPTVCGLYCSSRKTHWGR